MAREAQFKQGDRVLIVGGSATTGTRERIGFQATVARTSETKVLLQITTRRGIVRDWYRFSAVKPLKR